MQIIKENLDIDEVLEKRIKNTLKFLNIKSKIIKGNIIHIPKTNIAYIEPHKLEINEITYLFFNECENVYINTLEKFIPFNELENHIKLHKNQYYNAKLEIIQENHYKDLQKYKFYDIMYLARKYCIK